MRISDDLVLQVNPEVLRAQAYVVQGKVRTMQQAFQRLEDTIQKTSYYWIGEAGDSHRDYYEQQKEDSQTIFKRLEEDVDDLKQMASVYDQAENAVIEISEDLPSDVIV